MLKLKLRFGHHALRVDSLENTWCWGITWGKAQRMRWLDGTPTHGHGFGQTPRCWWREWEAWRSCDYGVPAFTANNWTEVKLIIISVSYKNNILLLSFLIKFILQVYILTLVVMWLRAWEIRPSPTSNTQGLLYLSVSEEALSANGGNIRDFRFNLGLGNGQRGI